MADSASSAIALVCTALAFDLALDKNELCAFAGSALVNAGHAGVSIFLGEAGRSLTGLLVRLWGRRQVFVLTDKKSTTFGTPNTFQIKPI